MELIFKLAGGGILIGCVMAIIFTDFTGGRTAPRQGSALMLRYPLALRVFCGLLLAFVVLWAFALADVDHVTLSEGIAIWSLLGVPVLVMCVESFGKKIVIDGGTVCRSYFGSMVIVRSTDAICSVARKEEAKVFSVRFTDGSSLWIPFPMTGSLEAATALQKKPNQQPQQQRP